MKIVLLNILDCHFFTESLDTVDYAKYNPPVSLTAFSRKSSLLDAVIGRGYCFVPLVWRSIVALLGIGLLGIVGIGSMAVVAKYMLRLTKSERAAHETGYFRARQELIVAWKRVYADFRRRRWGKAIWRGTGCIFLAYANLKRTTALGLLDLAIVNIVGGVIILVYTIGMTDIVYSILQIVSRFLEWFAQ